METEEQNSNLEIKQTLTAKELINSEKTLENRKEKLIKWVKNPYNIFLLIILIFSFFLYMHYFQITNTQTVWHDEAEYLSTANYWVHGIPYNIHPARPVLFPFLISIIFSLGLEELSVRFLLEIIPMLLSLIFMYLLVFEMYKNEKLALLSTFILSVSWIHIFYIMRVMTDTLGFLFGILAFYCLWKGYIYKKRKIYIWLIGFFVALSFLSRLTGILYGVFILAFLLLTDKLRFIKNKDMWISFFVSILTVSPYLIWSKLYHGTLLAFRQGYGGVTTDPIGWWMLNLLYDYPEKGFFIFFLIGLITLLPMVLSLDQILLKKNKRYISDFFTLFLILFTLGFFMYFLRLGENRWLMMMSIGIFILAGKGILLGYNLLNKNLGKSLAIVFIILVLFAGAYYQINHADNIIKSKISSYAQVKEAALWMKENSNSEDIIVTASVPQTVYYGERKLISFTNIEEGRPYTKEEFMKIIDLKKPKYMSISMFEPSAPEWSFTFAGEYPSKFNPVKVWFADETEQQPILIIYEINYNSSNS